MKKFFVRFYAWLALLPRLWKLLGSSLFQVAEKAVRQVQADHHLNLAAERESTVSYCPRCGQLPDGDRRQEEAREIALTHLQKMPRRSDLDFALALNYWLQRKG